MLLVVVGSVYSIYRIYYKQSTDIIRVTHRKIIRQGNTGSRDRPTHVALSIEMNATSWNDLLVTAFSDVTTS